MIKSYKCNIVLLRNESKKSHFMPKPQLRIRAVMQERGLSIKDLAERCNLSESHIQYHILGPRANPVVSTLAKLARAMDVPVASLIADYLDQYTPVIECPCCHSKIDAKKEVLIQ